MAMPRGVLVIGIASVALLIFSAANLAYHIARKPSELFFPVSGALNKTPAETWRRYAPLFREYSTSIITPELLAALAQVEGMGNPIAHTYWRWRLTWNPFAIYQPASSSVGMYQMTDAAFAEARRYCIRHHVVVAQGVWNDWDACWFNGLYTRLIPSHAIELTAIFLDREVAALLGREHAPSASPRQKEALATIAHLCGAGPASDFMKHGFKLPPGERCGDHDAATYLAHVAEMTQEFLRRSAER